MPRLIDITGQTFGRLTVIDFVGIRNKKALWRCRCECGRDHLALANNLKRGEVKSCGCLRKSWAKEHCTVHGDSRKNNWTRLYTIWGGMLGRCYNPNHHAFDRYGRRGITIEWPDYIAFREWALANGYADHLSIDRIENNRGYSPDNCRWATAKEQRRNQRAGDHASILTMR